MNVTYQMDEDDKGNQMDEENHDMDEKSLSNLSNFGTGNRKYPFNWGFLFCALNARAGTARRWRSPRSNGENEREEAHTVTRREDTHKERERDDGSLRASRDCGHAAKERKQVGGERIRGDWNYFYCCC
jgi:hypothetical protein